MISLFLWPSIGRIITINVCLDTTGANFASLLFSLRCLRRPSSDSRVSSLFFCINSIGVNGSLLNTHVLAVIHANIESRCFRALSCVNNSRVSALLSAIHNGALLVLLRSRSQFDLLITCGDQCLDSLERTCKAYTKHSTYRLGYCQDGWSITKVRSALKWIEKQMNGVHHLFAMNGSLYGWLSVGDHSLCKKIEPT